VFHFHWVGGFQHALKISFLVKASSWISPKQRFSANAENVQNGENILLVRQFTRRRCTSPELDR
jgi:hypothetical protein